MDHVLIRKVLFLIKFLSQFGGEFFNGLLLLLLCFFFSIYGKQIKRIKNSIHGCMGRKSKREKSVPYFTNGNEKKNLKGSAKLWYLLGLNYKSSCMNLYFLRKSYVASVNLFLSSPRKLERRPAFLHRLSPCITRLPGLVPQSDSLGRSLLLSTHASPHTSCSRRTRF